MPHPSAQSDAPDMLLETLAEFRYQLRRFLHFSEAAATAAGLHPQQHQLLLQIAGAPHTTTVSIAYVAERLGLKHNSTVELVNRCEKEELLQRLIDPEDKRRAILSITRKGRRILNRLSADHASELTEAAPQLAHALNQIKKHRRTSSKASIAKEAQ